MRYLTAQRDQGILIWMLNIGAEKYWNKVNAGIIDRNEDRIVNRSEDMNLLLCREQDILILRERPDEAYLKKMEQIGFSIPTILVPENTDAWTPISELVLQDESLLLKLSALARERKDVYFVPYAVTYLEERIAERCALRIAGPSSQVSARINDKIFNREIAGHLGLKVCQGKVCSSIEEIREEYSRLVDQAPYFKKVIIKEPHGASGKGLYIVEHESQLLPLLTRLSRFSRSNPEAKWLVEGWYAKKADINYQIYISPQGNVEVFSIKQQILRDTVYIGSRIPADVSPEVADAYQEYGSRIGCYLFQLGYTGVAGIDSIITEEDEIVPIIEINGRFTLSTYISFIMNVIGERKMFSRYFKLISDMPMTYEELCIKLHKEGLLYDEQTGEGIIAYTSGTLPVRKNPDGDAYAGRLFTLIAAKHWDTVAEYSTRLEAFVENISLPLLKR